MYIPGSKSDWQMSTPQGWLAELDKAKSSMLVAHSDILDGFTTLKTAGLSFPSTTTIGLTSNPSNLAYAQTNWFKAGIDVGTLRTVQDSFTRSITGATTVFSNLSSNPLITSAATTLASFQLSPEQQQRMEEARIYNFLIKRGWTVTKFLYEHEIFNELKQASKQKADESSLNLIYLSFFESSEYLHLESMLESWYQKNSFFVKRKNFFNDCLIILRKIGLSQSSMQVGRILIPVLIAQIDGILSDYVSDMGLLRKKSGIIDPKNPDKTWTSHRGWMEKLYIDDFTYYASVLFLDYLFEQAFPDGQASPLPVKSDLPENPELAKLYNRHKIMHGEILDYGSSENLIRTFLILDFIANLNYRSGWDAHMKAA